MLTSKNPFSTREQRTNVPGWLMSTPAGGRTTMAVAGPAGTIRRHRAMRPATLLLLCAVSFLGFGWHPLWPAPPGRARQGMPRARRPQLPTGRRRPRRGVDDIGTGLFGIVVDNDDLDRRVRLGFPVAGPDQRHRGSGGLSRDPDIPAAELARPGGRAVQPGCGQSDQYPVVPADHLVLDRRHQGQADHGTLTSSRRRHRGLHR